MKNGKGQELLAWTSEGFEYIVNCVVFLQDDFLLVDLHGSLKVDAVMEEAHQWLHVELVLHFIACHAQLRFWR